MRVFAHCAAAGCLAALVSISGGVTAQSKDPAPILAAARQALGGDKKISAVKSFSAAGRTRQVRGENLVPIEFEIFVELPDKYLRKDEIPAQESGPTASGFNGEEWLQDPPPPATPAPPATPPGAPAGAGAPGRGPGPGAAGPAGPAGPARNPAAARVTTVKQDFARLTLGMFATSFSSYPLTFKYAAVGEAPEGKADILDVVGPANFAAKFVVQQQTHLPVMLMWQQPSPNPQVKPTENRVYYADFRDVDGLKIPFRIRRAVGGDTVEETTFDRFRINVRIDQRKFEAKK
jgi:hypothetical protein